MKNKIWMRHSKGRKSHRTKRDDIMLSITLCIVMLIGFALVALRLAI